MSTHSYIPFGLPEIGEEEINEVAATLRSGWLTTGERTAQFEREFQAYVGSSRALAVSSGTAALHLSLAALGIGPGDEVITTPLTFCSTVHAILHLGATPVLADVGPDGNIDPHSIAERITPRTRAILPVHLGGLSCNMERIWALAGRYNLAVVEDAAHATGTQYRGHHVGSAELRPGSDAVAFSFYATKNMTTGEGGMVTTNTPRLAERMRLLTLHGISKDAWNRYSENGSWYYQVEEPGFKYNLGDIQSAIGIHQLRKLERFIERRTEHARHYNEALAGSEELVLPSDDLAGRHSWHLYMIRLRLDKLSIGRDQFIQELRRRRIGASVHFIPIPLHPFFAAYAARSENQCPRALDMYPRLVSLPLYPAMSPQQVDYVADSVKEILHGARRSKTIAAGSSV
jgi:dTDP-4-amino-4,6-dideoxygalactose transaminase